MKTFRTLELAIQFYSQVENMKVTGHLRDQLVRSASSVALNLSEGNAKPSAKEKRRFYQTAYASLKECQTIFKMLKSDDKDIISMADHLGASIYKLVQSKITEMAENPVPRD